MKQLEGGVRLTCSMAQAQGDYRAGRGHDGAQGQKYGGRASRRGLNRGGGDTAEGRSSGSHKRGVARRQRGAGGGE